MAESTITLLPQGVGYGVVVGVGLLFGLGMAGVTKFLSKFMGERSDRTEMCVMLSFKLGEELNSYNGYNRQVHGRESQRRHRAHGLSGCLQLDVGDSHHLDGCAGVPVRRCR